MYGLARTVAPTAEPLTLVEAKRHLRIAQEICEHDEEITQLILAARRDFELRTNRQIMYATWALKLPTFPYASGVITVPLAPLSSVTSIYYLEAAAGASTLWASSNYRVSATCEPGEIRLAYACSFPSVYPVSDAVTVTFVAGYTGDSSNPPMTIKHALKLRIQQWWSRDPGEIKACERAYESLVEGMMVGDEHVTYGEACA